MSARVIRQALLRMPCEGRKEFTAEVSEDAEVGEGQVFVGRDSIPGSSPCFPFILSSALRALRTLC